MKLTASTSDPLWYKDAIIYELHVKAFEDSNNDGIGDFGGLIQKLDYLRDLGVTCLWLLPFFPSPLKDDGYDISDYLGVHPSYGTLDDFKTFLAAAHDRNLQVLIELVVNHTSDQHPWFRAARTAPRGSPERDFYVWSDTAEEYRAARIIFTDTEKSNWTWDPVAQAYYWHRFFSHQPDLNFDNPRVMEEVLKALRFWLDLGVDAIRLDAIPYLVERDGTNCENLPETHVAIKRIRAEIDAHYENRMILAEANQWPTDVRPYFGDGEECHMAFHFPLMPRIYMGLRQEDRLPITDIMAQTPSIPDACQWGLFLRNHDELTLEMVTNDERDYMYLAYSADPRMRINLGIRRRLAPLVDNNRRRIELLNSLLFSFPGTPIIYYGDEIGMGDNIYLGDRNGVRTPMQWSGDRNAGFSRALAARLYSPVITDPVFGYEAINVEAQQSDQASLLNWMRNMIALRKLFRVFGRGTLEFLQPANRKILAYLRRYDGEQLLCVANLSRFAQPVDLDLVALEGMIPVEMLGYVEFPRITKQPYRLTLAPYGFLWLELHESAEFRPQVQTGEADESRLYLADGWTTLIEGPALGHFERVVLPEYLAKHCRSGKKARSIRSARVADWAALEGLDAGLCFVEVTYEDGTEANYFISTAVSFGERAESVLSTTPNAVLSSISGREGDGVLHDGLLDDNVYAILLSLIEDGGELHTRHGVLRGLSGAAIVNSKTGLDAPTHAPLWPAEQRGLFTTRSSAKFTLKLFCRNEPGNNPEVEIGRYLTEKMQFDATPPYAGSIEYSPDAAEPTAFAMLQLSVPNEGDGWKWMLEELERYYENCASVAFPPVDTKKEETPDFFELSEQPVSQLARDHIGISLDSAAALGRCTARMHLALGSAAVDPAFSPEPITSEYLHGLMTDFRERASEAFDALKENLSQLPDDVVEPAGLVLGRRRSILDNIKGLDGRGMRSLRTRIHGNYQLNSVLRAKSEYLVVDFGGDPTLPLAQRTTKHSPLKDVATMLRSFSYAAYAALMTHAGRRPETWDTLLPWARLWERTTAGVFLQAYWEASGNANYLPVAPGEFQLLLQAHVTDKALNELLHELNNPQGSVRIPLEGILSQP
ncbi:MAG: maltose alpha-D-glucosyltransferase [Bryobacteraceae bacterium]